MFTGGSGSYYFHEVQIYGGAQLAVETDPPESPATIFFENMIGDRSGAIHVGKEQEMDLERVHIDLPFSVHVYDGGFLGLAPDTVVHDVDIFLNGTLAHVVNLTVHHGGKVWLGRTGHTEDEATSEYDFEIVHVQNDGYVHMISDPVDESGIIFNTIYLHIDGGGLVRGTHLYMYCHNITIDAGGVLSADGLGYSMENGGPYEEDGETFRMGLHGIINPGLGTQNQEGQASGGGHGGSGGRGTGERLECGGG